MDKSKLANLKALAFKFLNFGATPEPEKFEAVRVKDSETMIEYNPTLEIGTPVLVSTGAESAPAPDQTYVLENGVEFVVKDGLIESVVNDGKQEPAKDQVVLADDEPKAEAVSKEDYEKLLARVEALEKKPKEDFSTIPTKAQLEAFTADLKIVGGVIEELSKIPMETPQSIESNPEQAREQAFSNVADHFAKTN